MSMLVRKGTMLHRNPSRKSTGRRSSRGSIYNKKNREGDNTTNSISSSPALCPPIYFKKDTENSRSRLDLCPTLQLNSAGKLDDSGLDLEKPRGSEVSIHLNPLPDENNSSSNKNLLTANGMNGSRRASSSTSQISSDERRQLYRYSKFVYESRGDYGSFFSQIREANEESKTALEFSKRFFNIFFRSAFATGLYVCIGLSLVTMTWIGVKNLQECPLEPNLPIYLLVFGIFGLLKTVWVLYNQIKCRKFEHCDSSFFEEDAIIARRSLFLMEWILNGFLICWFVLGNMWTFDLVGPNGESPSSYMPSLQQPNAWCSQVLFSFTLAHLYFVYGICLLFTSLWFISFGFKTISNCMHKCHQEFFNNCTVDVIQISDHYV